MSPIQSVLIISAILLALLGLFFILRKLFKKEGTFAIAVALFFVGAILVEIIFSGKTERLFSLFILGGGFILFFAAWLLRIPGFRMPHLTKEEQKNLTVVSVAGIWIPSLILTIIDSMLNIFPLRETFRLMFTDIVLGSILITPLYLTTLKGRRLATFQAFALGMALAAFLFLIWLAGNYLGKS